MIIICLIMRLNAALHISNQIIVNADMPWWETISKESLLSHEKHSLIVLFALLGRAGYESRLN